MRSARKRASREKAINAAMRHANEIGALKAQVSMWRMGAEVLDAQLKAERERCIAAAMVERNWLVDRWGRSGSAFDNGRVHGADKIIMAIRALEKPS